MAIEFEVGLMIIGDEILSGKRNTLPTIPGQFRPSFLKGAKQGENVVISSKGCTETSCIIPHHVNFKLDFHHVQRS